MTKKNKRLSFRKGFRPSIVRETSDDEMERTIRNTIETYVWPYEQRINLLLSQLENIKANQIALGTVLEKHNLVSSEEFQKEYANLQLNVIGIVNADGTMRGRPIFSIYNEDSADENSKSS